MPSLWAKVRMRKLNSMVILQIMSFVVLNAFKSTEAMP